MIVTHNLGKQGLTAGFIECMEKTFKNNDLVKVSVLKSATRNKQEIKDMAQEMCSELEKKFPKQFTAKVIGFKIYVRKWRKLQKK